MNAAPQTLPQTPVAPQVARSRKPLIIGILLVIALFAGTYAFAWLRARELTRQYMEQADASYANGDYLQALTGFQEFDEKLNRYVTRGGYFQVENIWAHRYARPVPPGVEEARTKVDEIINQRLTIEDAEQFIQVNSGRGSPYLGIIYLRLGELYEQEGDTREAAEIYESIPELFPNDPALQQRAAENLQRIP